VQVDPIKPQLKARMVSRLKLKWGELLSKFAFKFNLRRCTMARTQHATAATALANLSRTAVASSSVGAESGAVPGGGPPTPPLRTALMAAAGSPDAFIAVGTQP
jgi:hypothetical protein